MLRRLCPTITVIASGRFIPSLIFFICPLSYSPVSHKNLRELTLTAARCIRTIIGDLMTAGCLSFAFRSRWKACEPDLQNDACGRKCRIRSGNEVAANATDILVMCDADQQHYVARNRIYNTLYNMRISPNICSCTRITPTLCRKRRKLHDIPLLCA